VAKISTLRDWTRSQPVAKPTLAVQQGERVKSRRFYLSVTESEGMGVIRIVWGTASGPTAIASYDAALAAANVHNYNLVSVSSVVPADATIEVVGDAPSLGPAGERLTVVEGRSTVSPDDAGRVAACLGWSRESEGPGIFYESAGREPEAVRDRVDQGLKAGQELRSWDFDDEGNRLVTADADSEMYTTAVVLAVYGDSTPLL
jgi:arginine decarboxylase